MQAIVETLFDAAYLSTVVTLGILMIRRSKGNVQYTLFGWMAVVLGAGDAFHLIPRALALCTTGLESYTFALGLGKWITSVTMTVFYVLLYYVWRRRYQIEGKRGLTAAVDVGRQLQPAADVERADALRRVDLVTADGDEVRAERFRRERHLQKALHRVRVQQCDAVFRFQHPGDGGDVVDRAGLVVDHHE